MIAFGDVSRPTVVATYAAVDTTWTRADPMGQSFACHGGRSGAKIVSARGDCRANFVGAADFLGDCDNPACGRWKWLGANMASGHISLRPAACNDLETPVSRRVTLSVAGGSASVP